ncbi:uncharacterized protein LOC144168928 [Haemaphysalis longicornis]
MDFRHFIAALVLFTAPIGFVQAQGIMDVVKKLFDEKVTHAETKQLMIKRLAELEVCLMKMVGMTPQITMQVIDSMVPALNDCGMKMFSGPDDQKTSIFTSCAQEATAKVKASTGMGADDAKLLDDGMDCLRKVMTS